MAGKSRPVLGSTLRGEEEEKSLPPLGLASDDTHLCLMAVSRTLQTVKFVREGSTLYIWSSPASSQCQAQELLKSVHFV